METGNASIFLKGNDAYITQTENCAYQVRSGSVNIYIVPWVNGSAGRRIYLCESPENSVIPAFVYQDLNYKNWRFSLSAKGDAEVELVPMPDRVTSVLKKKFAKRAALEHFEEEGFENSLVQFYERESVKDEVFIRRDKKDTSHVTGTTYTTMQQAFRNPQGHVEGSGQCYKAVAFICRKLGQTPAAEDRLLANIYDPESVPDYAQAMDLLCREIVLEGDWYKSDCGPLVVHQGKKKYACIRKGMGRYVLYDPEDETTKKVTKQLAETIDPKAFSLGKPLPERSLTFKDLVRYAIGIYNRADLVSVAVWGLITTLIGVLLPVLNQKIYDDYIPMGSINELAQICIVIGAFMLGNLFFSVVKSIAEFRFKTRIGYSFQDAAYYRIFRLPESFFRDYDSADLAQRLMSVGSTANQFTSVCVLSVITTSFSVLYLVRMFKYSGKLGWISLLMVLIYAAILTPLSKRQVRYDREEAEDRGSASSKLYQYLNAIAKIRMAGAEDRAALDYMKPFSNVQSTMIRKNRISAVSLALSGVASTIFSIVLYYIVIDSKLDISMGAFVGFTTALGTFTGSLLSLINDLLSVYGMQPTYKRFKPIFDCACETQEDSEQPGKLNGEIEVSHVTFAYTEGQKPVLDNLSIKIHPGEYLGIVGSSGCGKSTLLKLLLGFEKPNSGHILYDGKDLASMDKHAFRKNLGVVLQNGRLISGSIHENITITAPNATNADVKRVIEAVGLKDDIAQMPMGIHTVLSENSSTISGGQQQRILIARAIIRNPSILIFDEATSALDNLTQAAVCESLDKMHATRIVVAHRLSTIRDCDRIIVLKDGRVVEEGNFESLMRQHGLFYELASRQIAE